MSITVGLFGFFKAASDCLLKNLLTYGAAKRSGIALQTDGSALEPERIKRVEESLSQYFPAGLNAKMHGKNAFHVAIGPYKTTTVHSFSEREEGMARVGYVDTPLSGLADGVNKIIVKILLKRGADVNAPDSHGYTPLHLAIVMGNEALVLALLNQGAYINARDHNGHTPLHWAVGRNHQAIATLLLNRGANVNAQDNRGVVAMSRAVELGNVAMVRILLGKGANLHIPNDGRETPWDVAERMDKEDIIDLFQIYSLMLSDDEDSSSDDDIDSIYSDDEDHF